MKLIGILETLNFLYDDIHGYSGSNSYEPIYAHLQDASVYGSRRPSSAHHPVLQEDGNDAHSDHHSGQFQPRQQSKFILWLE